MMITKFNKMIRNKVIWWIIGGIVIITFVGWFSPKGGCDSPKAAAAAGSLNGDPVTETELQQARFNEYLGLCLSVNHVMNITPRLDRELRDQAWKRVAALRVARQLNLSASREEVLAALQGNPQFQADGHFSKQRYAMFRENVLAGLNATVTQFEHQLSENIILQKLRISVASAVWMSPKEMKRMAGRYADSFKIDYVTLGTNLITATDITVTDADLKAYYTAHTNQFVVPPKVAVRYIQLPVSAYVAKAAAQTDTNAIEDYYSTHSEEFTETDTNGVKSVTPLEKVARSVSNKLIHASAVQLARDAVNDVADKLVPDRDGKAQTLDAVGTASNLTVRSTGLFDAEAIPAGIEAGPAFTEAAFRLRPTPDECFSDAIAGSNYVYLMTLTTNTEAYIPAFETIKAKVRAPAFAKATLDALDKKAQELHQYFETGLSRNMSFNALAKAKAMNVSTSELFSVYSAPDTLSSQEILSEVTLRNAHELTEVLPGTDGLIIAYVVERKPAGEEELATIQSQILSRDVRRRAGILFEEWQKSLVSGGKLKDNRKQVDVPEDKDPGEGEL